MKILGMTESELEDGRTSITVEVDVGSGGAVVVEIPSANISYDQLAAQVRARLARREETLARREHELLQEIHRRAMDALEATGTEKVASTPPRLAEWAVSLFAPKNTAQALLGDMQEMFLKNVARLGEREARRKYWMQATSSAAPLIWQWFKRIGFFTVLIDYFRSKLGF